RLDRARLGRAGAEVEDDGLAVEDAVRRSGVNRRDAGRAFRVGVVVGDLHGAQRDRVRGRLGGGLARLSAATAAAAESAATRRRGGEAERSLRIDETRIDVESRRID